MSIWKKLLKPTSPKGEVEREVPTVARTVSGRSWNSSSELSSATGSQPSLTDSAQSGGAGRGEDVKVRRFTLSTLSGNQSIFSRDMRFDESSPSPKGGGDTARTDHVRTVVSRGVTLRGKMYFTTPVRIDGNFTGEISSSSSVIISPSARVSAILNAAELLVFGVAQGEFKISERIEIMAKAQVDAALDTPRLVAHEGANFNGSCTMIKDAA